MGSNVQFHEPDPRDGRISNAPSEFARRATAAVSDVLDPTEAEVKAEKRHAAKVQAVAALKVEIGVEIQSILAEIEHDTARLVRNVPRMEGLLAVVHARSKYARDECSSYELTDMILAVLERSAKDLKGLVSDEPVQTRWSLGKFRDYWKARFVAVLYGKES